MDRIEQIGDVLFNITKTLKKITENSLKDYGLGIGQLQVLLLFYSGSGRILTQQEIVKILKVDKGNISRNVSKLVEKKFIQLVEEHERQYGLTEVGERLKGELMNFFLDTHQKMIGGITEEDLMITLNCLLKMNENLEEL